MPLQPNYEIENGWLSAYIFYESEQPDIYGSDCDRVIHHVVAPFVTRVRQANWCNRYFFIRYSERGNHVRLRFQGDGVTLAEQVAPTLARWVADCATVIDLPLRVEWVPYEPEITRYGGDKAIFLAEQVFEYSSDTCLGLMEKLIGTPHKARLGQALLLMSVLTYTFTDSPQMGRDFSRRYGMGYLSAMIPEQYRAHWMQMFNGGFDRQANTLIEYVHEVWARLNMGDSLTPYLDDYYHKMRLARSEFEQLFASGDILLGENSAESWFAAIRNVVSSYNHMMNNRLGVSIVEEMYLAYLIARALESELPLPEKI